MSDSENSFQEKVKLKLNTILLVVGALSLVSSMLIAILGFSDTLHDLSTGLLWGGVLVLFAALIKNIKTVFVFFKKKQTLYGLNSVLMALLVLALLGMANYLGQKNPLEYDLTEEGINTLSEQTISVVLSLKSKLLLTVILKKEHQPAARDLFGKYKKLSPDNFEFKFLDEKTDPVAVKTFIKNRSKTAKYGMASLTINPGDADTKREIFIDQAREETITNGIIRLTQSKKPVIYFITGHGELEVGSSNETGIDMVVESLTASGNEVKSLNLAGRTELPKDAALVVVAGPQFGYVPEEIALLRKYLTAGGRGIFLLDPDLENKRGKILDVLLSEMGVDIVKSVVLDPRNSWRSWAIPLIFKYAPLHPVTKGIKGLSYFPVAQIVKVGSPPRGMNVEWLFQGSAESWGESDLKQLKPDAGIEPKYNAGKDVKGPANLAVAVSGILPGAKMDFDKNKSQKEMKLIVVGNSSFMGNQFASAINHDLFLNMVNWMTGQEDLISIRPKKERKVQFQLTDTSMNSISLLSWAGFPMFFLATSFFVYFRRRSL